MQSEDRYLVPQSRFSAEFVCGHEATEALIVSSHPVVTTKADRAIFERSTATPQARSITFSRSPSERAAGGVNTFED